MSREILNETFATMFSNAKYAEYVFYAHIIAKCEIRIENELQFIAGICFKTDHFQLLINTDEFGKLPINQRIGVLKHEILHAIYGHCTVRGVTKNRMIANIAMDCAINQHINSEDLPRAAIYPETLSKMLKEKTKKDVFVPNGLTFEEYYNIIIENIPTEDKNDCELSGFDDHSEFGNDNSNIELAKQVLKNAIESATRATLAGNSPLPGEHEHLLGLVAKKVCDVDWRKMFKNISSNTKSDSRETYKRRSRRFGDRIEIKGKTKDYKFNWLTILDVSGSVSDKEIVTCLEEVILLCKKMNVESDMVQVDTEAYPSTKIKPSVQSINREAHGGTTLYPAIEQANNESLVYDAVLVLTDGGLFANDIDKFKLLNKPVIFIVTDKSVDLNIFSAKNSKAAYINAKK